MSHIHIDIQNVSFGYEKEQPILQQLSLHASEHEAIGIIGANGVGKSTLLKLLVTQLLLSYRYLTLLLEQADTIAQAYALRAPKQKGVHFKVWGSLAGQLLLRSIDRANNLYDSMLLRGYQGEYYYGGPLPSWVRRDWLYLLGLVSTLLAIALLPGEQLLGQLMSFLG